MGSHSVKVQQRIRLGEDFELDANSYQLRRSGRVLRLERIPTEILIFLAEQPGQLVSREEIAHRVWGKDAFLDTDNSINGAIRKIRQVLKDDPEQPRFIQTITGRGYRLIASVEPVADPPATPVDPEPESAPSPPLPTEAKSHRWPRLIALSVLIAAILGTWLLTTLRARPRSSGERVMLAVLPFENLTGDASQDYFSDGMTEELITELGHLNPDHLGVIARTSVMLYKNSSKPLDQVGRELGVQYVLEGSVRRDAGRVRITAQLVQVKDQTPLWARQYDRELKDLLLVQSEIARGISDEIQTALGDSRPVPPVKRSPLSTQEYEAHDLYLQGRYFWNRRTGDGFQKAIDYFQQAIAKDQNYAPAYAGLADTYALMSTWNVVPPNEAMPKARAAALKALEIDEASAEAHTSLGLIAEAYDYDWPRAEKEFRRALELNPDYATAHQWYAECLAWQGRFDEAMVESERARQLDPLSLIISADQGTIYYQSRQYDRAIARARTILQMDPNFVGGRNLMFGSLLQAGKFQEDLEFLDANDVPDSLWYWAHRACIYSWWGKTSEVENAQAKLQKYLPHLGPERIWVLVMAYGNTDQKDKVIDALDEAFAQHSFNFSALKVDPEFDPLRNDPRFQDLLHRVGLAPR